MLARRFPRVTLIHFWPRRPAEVEKISADTPAAVIAQADAPRTG